MLSPTNVLYFVEQYTIYIGSAIYSLFILLVTGLLIDTNGIYFVEQCTIYMGSASYSLFVLIIAILLLFFVSPHCVAYQYIYYPIGLHGQHGH